MLLIFALGDDAAAAPHSAAKRAIVYLAIFSAAYGQPGACHAATPLSGALSRGSSEFYRQQSCTTIADEVPRDLPAILAMPATFRASAKP